MRLALFRCIPPAQCRGRFRPDNMPDVHVHVVVGVVVDDQRRILLSRRPAHVHQGELWEFPGGKVEPGETVPQALRRELDEELGIVPVNYRPLIRIYHDYPDRRVLLDVWRVENFQGQNFVAQDTGREGQEVRWVTVSALSDYCFPAANRPIVTAARLPGCYLITPEPEGDMDAFLTRIRRALDSGIRLLRLRAWSLDTDRYLELARHVISLCHRYQARVLLSGDLPQILEGMYSMSADGLHLNRHQLMQLQCRPLADGYFLAASCHNRSELEKAQESGVDFVTLSPVLATPSHPDAAPLGWQQFQNFNEHIALPVYAFGGMTAEHLGSAWIHGGQGVAAVRAFWPDQV